MAIRKSNDISNDPAINSRLRTTVAKDEILQRFNPTKTDNILPCDDGLTYLSEKVDQCIDVVNVNETKVTFPGIGTTSSTCKAGNTTTFTDAQATRIAGNSSKVGITPAQASAITANTAKTGISSSQTSAITANTSKTGFTSGHSACICAITS